MQIHLQILLYQPEKVSGFEAGVKALLNEGSLEVNFDIYDYTYDDLQLNYFNAATFAYRTLNAEEVRIKRFRATSSLPSSAN